MPQPLILDSCMIKPARAINAPAFPPVLLHACSLGALQAGSRVLLHRARELCVGSLLPIEVDIGHSHEVGLAWCIEVE